MIQLLVWSTNFYPPPKTPDFFQTKLIRVGVGSGLGFGLQIMLELVSKVVFWAFFEIAILITLEPRGPHQMRRFLYFILDNNPFVR